MHGRLVGATKRDEREKLGFANVDEREGTRRVRSSRSLTVGG